ncbi:MAG: hypothetical protein ACXAE3_01635 [Candidatus Kariarchaeaceae archaeon]
MIKEYLSSDYTFYKFPNTHIIFLVPLIPSLVIVLVQTNLNYVIEGTFTTTYNIQNDIIKFYFFYFKLILSIVTSFYYVYRWGQQKIDGSYGFWISQGVNREQFVIFTVISYALLISTSQIVGLLTIWLYLGIGLGLSTFFVIMGSILTSNLLYSLVGIFLADTIKKPEVAGLVFIGLSFLNYVLIVDPDSLVGILLQLESNFTSQIIGFAILFEVILFVIIGSALLYLQRFWDIEL